MEQHKVNDMRKQNKVSGSSEKAFDDRKILENPIVNIKLKLSILWITLLWFYGYNDIISMFRQDTHEDALAGEFGGIVMSPEFLVGASLLMAIPIKKTMRFTLIQTFLLKTYNHGIILDQLRYQKIHCLLWGTTGIKVMTADSGDLLKSLL